jgi:tRNA(adenine34) deaminase
VRRRRTGSGTAARRGRRWSHEVHTVSTYPPPGLFTKDAETIARVMATPEVSPKGIGSGIRMVQFFINRAGKNLPARQRRELERAKRLLQARRAKQEEEAK